MTSPTRNPLPLVACLLAFTAASAPAATTVTYEFTGGSLAPTTVDPDGVLASAGNLTPVSQDTFSTTSLPTNRTPVAADEHSFNVTTSIGTAAGGTWRSNAGGAANTVGSADLTTPTTVNTPGRYFGFTVTLAEPVTLESLSMDLWKPATSQTRGFSVWYSLDGWTTSKEGGWFRTLDGTGNAVNFSIDLTAVQAAQVTSAVEFRFYNINASATAENRFDNIRLTIAPIPEPASGMLLGLVVVGLCRRRR